MSTEFFGTDGIRGPAGVYPLDAAGATQVGKATGAYFTKPGDVVLVACDPRESSEMLVNAVTDGLVAMGAEVRKIGVIPTPGLAYLTKREKARAGVMITASHNPYTDNGIKIFTPDGSKLADDAQDNLNALIGGTIEDRLPGASSETPELVTHYEDFLIDSARGASFTGLRLGVDTANGASSGIAARVFTQLGAKVTAMFDEPDGRNINVQCGATDTTALRAAVQEQGLQAGAAFDGDADRLILVDEQGRELTGDHLMYILAVAGGQKGVVATIMTNQGLETALKQHDIALHRTAVGDRSVSEGLTQTGFKVGGEQSGHIILPELSDTGDGMLAAIQILTLVLASGKTLANWYDELVLLPQALINLPVTDKSLLARPDVQDFIASQTAELGSAGRLNIRPSGTEPKVRVMVEAPDAAERAKTIADQLSKLLSPGGAA